MHIAVVGAGNMGKALARRWIRAGHSVSLSFSRSHSMLLQWAAPFGSLASVTTPGDAVAGADVVLLSVPFEALDEAIGLMGDGRRPMPLVTTVSPYSADFTGKHINLESRLARHSAAEEIAQRLPNLQVIEAFNLVFADLLVKDSFPFSATTVPLCGDHGGAKCIISDLVRDAGLEPLDVGALRVARTLEPMATAWVQLAAASGLFPDASLTFQRRADPSTFSKSDNSGV